MLVFSWEWGNLPGGRAAGGGGVDGRAKGIRFVPVLFESFLDSALGGGELHGGGLVLRFLVVALGAWVLSEHGGPGGSVLATLFSGPSSSGGSFGGVLGAFGGLGVNGSGTFDRLRVNGSGTFDGLGVSGSGPFDRLRVNGSGPFDKLRVNGSGPFDRLRVNGSGPFDKLRVNGSGPFDRLRVNGSGPFGGLRTGSFDRLRVNGRGPFDRLRVSGSGRFGGPFDGAQDRPRVEGMGSRLRGNDGCVGIGLLVADDVYDELLGGGDPVVALEAVVPVLHDVVEELDYGAAVGRLGSDEPGHEVFVYRREHSKKVFRKGARGVLLARRIRGGAGVGRAGASTGGVAAGDAAVPGDEPGGVL